MAAIELNFLRGLIDSATTRVKQKLDEIKGNESAISIGAMFEMQMLMNHLSQLSEMSTSIASASHQAVQGFARNVKA